MRNIVISALATVMLLTANLVSAQDLTATSIRAGSSGGSINLSVDGGYTPYEFAWTGPNGLQANTEDISNLAAGEYCVNVKDALCGTVSLCVTVQTCSPVTFSINSTPTCSGQSNGTLTVVDAPPNSTYQWSNGSVNSSISGLSE